MKSQIISTLARLDAQIDKARQEENTVLIEALERIEDRAESILYEIEKKELKIN